MESKGRRTWRSTIMQISVWRSLLSLLKTRQTAVLFVQGFEIHSGSLWGLWQCNPRLLIWKCRRKIISQKEKKLALKDAGQLNFRWNYFALHRYRWFQVSAGKTCSETWHLASFMVTFVEHGVLSMQPFLVSCSKGVTFEKTRSRKYT